MVDRRTMSSASAGPFPGASRSAVSDRRERDRRRWTALATLLVAAGLAGAVFLAQRDTDSSSSEARIAFRSSATSVASALRLAIQHEEDLIVSGAAFVATGPRRSQAGFRAWGRSVNAFGRYPELQALGFVVVVPAAKVAAFGAALPGAGSARKPFAIVPPGKRPFYCLGQLGLARSGLAAPPGQDYCVSNATNLASRDSGRGSYVPLAVGFGTWLAVYTPVYRGGGIPATVAARRRLFIGWIGDAINPNVVLARSLQGTQTWPSACATGAAAPPSSSRRASAPRIPRASPSASATVGRSRCSAPPPSAGCSPTAARSAIWPAGARSASCSGSCSSPSRRDALARSGSSTRRPAS